MNQPRRAHRYASLSLSGLILSAASLLAFAAAAISWTLADLWSATAASVKAVECCGTIFSTCLLSLAFLSATLPWLGIALLAAGLANALWHGCRNVRSKRSFLARLKGHLSSESPARLEEASRRSGVKEPIRLLDLDLPLAFTAGLLRPRLHVSRGLCEALSAEELSAVLLHEEHHRRCRDPLRYLVLEFCQDLLFWLPAGYFLRRSFLEARENAADDAALERGGGSLCLASALCRLARRKLVPPPEVQSLSWIAGAEGKVERRLKRLLFPESEARPRYSPAGWLASAGLAALLLFSLSLPLISGPLFTGAAGIKNCHPPCCCGSACVKGP